MSTVTCLSGPGFYLALCFACGVVLAWMLVGVLDRLATKESFFATSCPAPAGSAHNRTPPATLDRCPKCRWICQPSECAKSCTPICSPPACRIKCKPLAAPRCRTQCEPPRCRVVCADRDRCVGGRCPSCVVRCDPPQCKATCCAPRPDCVTQCDPADCTWSCSKPKHCPPPKCELQCD